MKEFVIRFFKAIAFIIGIVGGIISISMAIQDINKWYFAAYGIGTTFLSMLFFFLLGERVHRARHLHFLLHQHIKIFKNTHNTWHMYKRLIDTIVEEEELDLDELLSQLRLSIANLINNFREAIIYRHKNVDKEDFRVSLKLINYKNANIIDFEDKESYKDLPFILKDIPFYRDTAAGPIKKEDIIDNLDFDEATNAKNIDKLKQSLFWDCFLKKKVVFVDKFTETQQELTKIYKSGMVAPVVLHEIPLAFLCVGTQNEEVFHESDLQLVCTFVDALSEYFRLERSLTNMIRSKKVVVLDMSNDVTQAIQSIIENKSLLEHKDKDKDKDIIIDSKSDI